MVKVFSPFFTEAEFGINDLTTPQEREKLFLLMKMGLDPIRAKFGPTKITSGIRSLLHNAQIGGVDDSQHVFGEAVDFVCTALPEGQTMQDVFNWLKTWWPGQCFYYLKRGHIHIALPTVKLAAAGRLYAVVLDK